MSRPDQQSDLRLRVVLVGRTGLDQSLRREPSVELIRARTALDAIGEVCDPIDADSPARSLVVMGADADPGHESEQFVAAVRLADPKCKVVTIEHGINGHSQGAYDAIVPPNASLAMLRRIVVPGEDSPAPAAKHEHPPKLAHEDKAPAHKLSEPEPAKTSPPPLPVAHTSHSNGHAHTKPAPAKLVEVIEHTEPPRKHAPTPPPLPIAPAAEHEPHHAQPKPSAEHHEHKHHEEAHHSSHHASKLPPPLPVHAPVAHPAPALPKEFQLPEQENPSAPRVFHVRPHEPAEPVARVTPTPPPLPAEPDNTPAPKELIVPQAPPMIMSASALVPPPLPIIAAPPTDIETARQLAKQPVHAGDRPRVKGRFAKVHPDSPKPAETKHAEPKHELESHAAEAASVSAPSVDHADKPAEPAKSEQRQPTVAEMLAAWAPVKPGATPPPLPVEPSPAPHAASKVKSEAAPVVAVAPKVDPVPVAHAPVGAGMSVGSPMDDAELLRAALSGRDITEPALGVIRKRLGRADIILAPVSASPTDGVRVEHRGKLFGHLMCSGLDAKALAPHALWLGDWLTLRDQHEALKKAALYDELTGAYNRRYFDGFLKEAIDQARRARTSVTLMVFDVDNFKRFNDEHGHAAGDEILKSTVALLRSVIREGDRVCRIGGDEFVVVFSEPTGPRELGSKPPTDVAAIAARFQKQIASSRFPMLGESAPGALSISGGLATYPWDGHNPAELLERADQLALESKRAGKNCITIGPGTQRTML